MTALRPTQPAKAVTFILPSLTSGGAERVIVNLMNGLDRQLFSPSFITISPKGELRPLIAPDIPVISLNHDRVSRAIPALLKTLWQQKPDIIISTMSHLNFVTLALKPFFPGTRFVVREAIVPSFFFETQKHAELIRQLYKWIYPFADKIISPSQKMIDEFHNLVGLKTHNHILLCNPVDVNYVRAQAPSPRPMPLRTEFVCAGRLHHQKGFDRLIESLSRFHPTTDWHLTIWGEGQERENLTALIAKHNLSDKVTLAGLTTAPWPHIAAADAFLLPSRYEGLPNVVLEALAVGTPVIATRESGGIDEIAAMTDPAVLTVTDSMDEFLSAMSHITPAPTQTMRPSKLPPAFWPQNINAEFSSLLQSLT